MYRVLLSGCLAAALLPTEAVAQQVNRCTDAQGRTIFSDRRCADIGAQSRLPATARPAGSNGLYRDTCARRLSDIVAQIQHAAEGKDVNRLSGIYWWPGVSRQGADNVISQLESIVQRPLLDIAPVFPVPQTEQRPLGQPLESTVSTAANNENATWPSVTVEPGQPKPRPIGLRLEQTLSGQSATPARTILYLRRQYNCFWISL